MELATILRQKAKQLLPIVSLLRDTAKAIDQLRRDDIPGRRPMELAVILRKEAALQSQLEHLMDEAAEVVDLLRGNENPSQMTSGVKRLYDLLSESAKPLTRAQMAAALKERQLHFSPKTIGGYLSSNDCFVQVGHGLWTVV